MLRQGSFLQPNSLLSKEIKRAIRGSKYGLKTPFQPDHWIEIFGRENRFDHNHIGTKWNLGATMVMRLGDSISTDNQNSIDSNFFGAKPRLGSNGALSMTCLRPTPGPTWWFAVPAR